MRGTSNAQQPTPNVQGRGGPHPRLVLLVLVALLCAFSAFAEEARVVLREDFDTLDAWRPLVFGKIGRHTRYDVVEEGTNRVLRAEAQASASGLTHTNTFDVTSSPVLTWRWKAEAVFAEGDARRKDGDDYPIRVYVVFKYDPQHADFGTRAMYGLARKRYGAYPPHSSLNYIWANRQQEQRILSSPYTDRSKMIILRAGTNDVGQWVEERVNILDDYRTAFGEDPPSEASLAVMSDSDNTGEAVVSYVDALELRRRRSAAVQVQVENNPH